MRNRWLTGLVAADFFLAILTIAVEAALHWTLPETLRAHVQARGFDFTLTAVWVAMCVATLLAWAGLLLQWKHAPAIYVGAWIVDLALTAAYGPSVMTGVGGALDTLEHLAGGAIIGLLFFTSVPAPESPAVP
jgi:hypothetical protein